MAVLALGHYILWIIAAATAGVCLFAWVHGGPAEKLGAAMVTIAWAIVMALQSTVTHGATPLWIEAAPVLFLDFLLSFGLLVLSLRYASLWLGIAMLAQSAQLALHAFFIAEGGRPGFLFALGSNVSSGVLLTALLCGTAWSWRRRSQLRREEAYALP